MSTPSLNSSTKTALISLTRGTLELDPATKIPEQDANFVAMIREYREQANMQQHIEPMLEKRHIPQTLKEVTEGLDLMEMSSASQVRTAYQSLSPRVLDITARVSERTEQHVRLVEDVRKVKDEIKNFFRKAAKTLWGTEAKKPTAPLMQQPEGVKIKKDTKAIQARREDLAKNLPELAMRLKALQTEIRSHSAALPTQGMVAPRQEQS